MQTLRLASEDQAVIIDLMRGPIRYAPGFQTQTPSMGGAYTYEPFGAQFDFSNYQPMTETFDIVITGSRTTVLDALERLQNFLESVRLFHSGDLAALSYWLEWSADGEDPKRSLLYSGQFKVLTRDDITPGLEVCKILGTLALTRHPLWEDVTLINLDLTDSVPTVGGHVALANVTGNVPARIEQFTINSAQAGIGLDNHWTGWRRFNQGTTNFEPVWECEDGTNGTDAADAVDATASAGDRVTVTYVTLTLVSRMTITVAQVCAAAGHVDYNHQQGRYLVLCRCMLSAAGTTGIQMRSGYTGNTVAEEQYIDNVVWRFIPLGNISIPPWEGDRYSANPIIGTYRIDIYAEQMTPGHNLYLDCLVLIPNEHMITLAGCTTQSGTSEYIFTNEDDTEVAYEYAPLVPQVSDAIEFGATNWYLPNGNSVVVIASEDVTTPDIANRVGMEIQYIPRWLMYRTD